MRLSKLASVVTSLLVIGVALFSDGAYATASAKQAPGKIMGVILDINKARVTNAIVKVEGGNIRRKVASDDQGRFEVSLPAGSYQITVEANGFRRFVSSTLKLRPNHTAKVNIQVDVAAPRGLVPAVSIGRLA